MKYLINDKIINMYLELDKEAQEKGFDNYQDKREFETGNKEELKEIREIQKEIDIIKKENIIKSLNWIIRYYKLNYLNIYFTDKGTLVFKDLEENNRTLRNCKNKLLHNKTAINWLINECVFDSEYIKTLEEIKEVL